MYIKHFSFTLVIQTLCINTISFTVC